MTDASARDLPTYDDVVQASHRLRGRLHRTPVLTSSYLDGETGAHLFFKCENFQRVGAFKARGALNAILLLTDAQRRAGVVTHSSGNHGQAVAWAARSVGAKATVVMPRDSAPLKIDAVRGYGAEVVLCEPGTAARDAATKAILAGTGATLVHPYDDAAVIAGQGTAALELLDEARDLDIVMTPVGGGGLLAGTALAVRGLHAGTVVIGAEPELADDGARSLASGRIETSTSSGRTMADGLRSSSVGVRPFAILREQVQAIWTVSEAEIAAAHRLVIERMKIVIEPSSAVPVAALLRHRGEVRGKRVGVILTGGNVDLFDGRP